MIAFHKHRIVPGHMGGTYEASNVIRVNVAMHAFLHKCLYEKHGHDEDKRAWLLLTRMICREKKRLRAVSRMGKQRWAHDAEYRAKMIHAQSNVSDDVRVARSEKAKRQWADPEFRARAINSDATCGDDF